MIDVLDILGIPRLLPLSASSGGVTPGVARAVRVRMGVGGPAFACVECFRGESLDVEFVSPRGEDVSGKQVVFRLLSAAGDAPGDALLSLAVGSGVTFTLSDRAVATLSAGDTDRAAGVYYYTLSCADAGGEAVLTRGPFAIFQTYA